MKGMIEFKNQKASKEILLLIEDGATAKVAPEASFAERKASQLKEEREGIETAAGEAPQTGDRSATLPEKMESEQSDGDQELRDSSEAVDADSNESDLEETPDTELPEESDEPTVDWEKRFNDTKAELTRVQMDRSDMDAEHADMMSSNMQLSYQLEDKLSEVESSAGFFVNNLNQQIANLEAAFNQGQVAPDQMMQARQHYQQIVNNRNQMTAQIEQAKQARTDAEDTRKKREAEITRVRLARSIPDWSREKYAEMRTYAEQRGYSGDEFNDFTDHRIFELLHDSMMLRQAQNTIQNVNTKRAPKERVRGQRKPRDGQGRFQKAKKEFAENPNQTGRFAAMKAEQLSRERKRR